MTFKDVILKIARKEILTDEEELILQEGIDNHTVIELPYDIETWKNVMGTEGQ